MLTQQHIDFIYEDLKAGFHHVWDYIGIVHGISSTQINEESFEEIKNDFFFAVERLLNEGKLKLGNRKTEIIVEGTTEELLKMFRNSFPGYISHEDLDTGLWFFTDCPFIAAWLFKEAGENGEDCYGWCY
ncbi:DUF596 domain-containing protein [Xylella fastidiosa subsp. sandyi]|uniref:DUF596 domain-containing protein n=1 Tax=Xylella fastidiosa TaxID=2371 RepID=UPI000707BDEA|nr:DUF596 domain-containing protein [Xylella fastidiosa]KQH72900.1 hypothetical protein AOT81_11305 [Xylella fastidiosa]KQH72952.1 hypothetical protein AOT81_10985 [Xylella fastidiosa]RWA43509.1 DUF596 domain-containing protein [Xylella fastidiosa subsp. sandyi]WNY18169.1 DUF596 domain-containing protein [Xylella fastidiosa]WNY20457.1 DUF596 domain-containing protein [Xylella fastidiosa]